MRKILITGGAGFIGQHLAKRLIVNGCSVTILDTFEQQIHGENAKEIFASKFPELQLFEGNVCNRSDWLAAIQGVDSIVHFAAQTGTGQSMYQIARYSDVNIGGTAMMWDVLTNEPNTVKKVLVASSRAIYGEGSYRCDAQCGLVVPPPRGKQHLEKHDWFISCPKCGASSEPIATPEESLPQPASLYACTKLAQEQICLTMGKALGLTTVALRFQNVFGPGQSLRNPYTGIISIFSNQMRQDLPINIYEDGEETRDFIYVEDVVDICIKSLEFASETLVLNVGSGQPTKVVDLAFQLRSLWESNSSITVTGDFRVGDIRHNWADLTKISQLFPNWQPTNLAEGLREFVEWAKSEAIYEDHSHIASQELKQRNL